jgi:hypothetical protein
LVVPLDLRKLDLTLDYTPGCSFELGVQKCKLALLRKRLG